MCHNLVEYYNREISMLQEDLCALETPFDVVNLFEFDGDKDIVLLVFAGTFVLYAHSSVSQWLIEVCSRNRSMLE